MSIPSVLPLLLVEIANEPITPSKPFTEKGTGLQKLIPAKQAAYVHQGDRYPLKTELSVDEVHGPHKPGMYLLAGEVFASGEYGRLKFSDRKLQLVSLAEALPALTALLKG